MSEIEEYQIYERHHLDQLLEAFKNTYSFEVEELDDSIFEIGSVEIPIIRILYSEDSKMIILCFHIDTSAADAIQLFNFARQSLSRVTLGENYYVNAEGTLFMGADAQVQYENDVEKHYLTNAQVSEKEYKPLEPILLTLPYPLYAAGHPQADKLTAAFRRRLALFKGKSIK